MTEPTPTPVPVSPHAPQWTPNNVFGILCQIAAICVFWLVPDDAGRGMGTALLGLAVTLLGISPPVPVGGGASRGNARVGFLGLVIVASAIAAMSMGGCGATLVNAEKTVTLDMKRPAPCVIKVLADGQIVSTTTGPNRCEITVDGKVLP